MNPDIARRAEAFHALHQGPELLVLANAWDAASARLFESLGAKAVATTSAGVAWAHGYPDDDTLPLERLLATVSAITRVIQVPLTVDIEGGYSDDPAEVGATVARLIEAGAVGINLEDGTGSPAALCEKLAHVKQASQRLGVRLFVNVRTDVYLRGLVPEAQRQQETLARAEQYRAAGADGLFVPALVDTAGLQAIAKGTTLPVNAMVHPGLPDGRELQRLGVRRLSSGASIPKALWSQASALVSAFLADGRSEPLCNGAASYVEVNAMMKPASRA
ncbi:isocitrate lyase/PEP mutase family protein [Myxococcus sp. Y35]|uniref:isocitrate lyase/PEP mutase family protein n=1 Tax=Pseudomyxococcus flavus TaxID=3115648 RepID=UPI003CF3E8AB